MALIMIVDDSSYQRGVIRKVMQRAGHEVMDVQDGQEALKIIGAKPPDCILMDLIMPGVSGLGVLNTLVAQRKGVPVVIVTADIQESVRNQCLELGAQAVLNKPVNEQELCSTVDRILKSKVGAKNED